MCRGGDNFILGTLYLMLMHLNLALYKNVDLLSMNPKLKGYRTKHYIIIIMHV